MGPAAAAIVALVILFSTVGLMPQLLGGYPAQLNLNNSGDYYDAYYVHDQEIAALNWLGEQLRHAPGRDPGQCPGRHHERPLDVQEPRGNQ